MIVVTSDLGRVTTAMPSSLNDNVLIVVTSDLGRVTTLELQSIMVMYIIVVTSDLGRVTTATSFLASAPIYCGDVRSRTSYNQADFASSDICLLW